METETVQNTEPKHTSNNTWVIVSLVTLVILLLGYILFTQFLSTSEVAVSPTPTRIPTFSNTGTPTVTPVTETTPAPTSATKSPTTLTPTKTITPTSSIGGLKNPSSPTPTKSLQLSN